MDANSHGWRQHAGQFDMRSRRAEFGTSRQPARNRMDGTSLAKRVKERDTARRQVLIEEHRRDAFNHVEHDEMMQGINIKLFQEAPE